MLGVKLCIAELGYIYILYVSRSKYVSTYLQSQSAE